MRFGLFTAHDRTLQEGLSVWSRAEQVGFDAVGVVDSPMLMREALVSLTAVALQTTRVQIFPCVMNTLTRDVTVVAGAYLGLRDLVGDRVFLCLGAGDSSTYGSGLGTAPLCHMEAYISALRSILQGEEGHIGDRLLTGHWHGWGGVKPRIFMSAHGPRSLQAAGRIADGVISGYGVLPEHVARAEALIRAGAEEAGRDPNAIEIWHRAYYVPHHTVEEGFMFANGCGASILARGGLKGKMVPPELASGVEQVAKTWSLSTHGGRANVRALEVAERTGVLPYLVARGGGMVGPCDVADGIAALEQAGVRNLLFVALGEDKLGLVDGLASGMVRYSGRRGAERAHPGGSLEST